ncbi:MAG: M50 family metallopeptidase [Leptonema sp. (in: bacteria)]
MSYYWIVLFTFLISFFLWESIFLFPLKMIAVLIHELWHSLVAIFFNIERVEFHIFPDETGKTILKGSVPLFGFVLISIAGYIGTLFTGSFFLRFFLQENLEDLVFFLFSMMLLVISFVLPPIFSLGFYVSLGWALLFGITYILNKKISKILFTILLSFLIFYSFYDLFDFSKNPYQSDLGILYKYLQKNNYYSGDFKKFLFFSSLFIVLVNIYIFYKLILSLIFTNITKEETLNHTQNNLQENIQEQNQNSKTLTSENQTQEISINQKEIDQIVKSIDRGL